MLSQLLERELDKCLRLVVAIPMDMSTFYGKTTFCKSIFLKENKDQLYNIYLHKIHFDIWMGFSELYTKNYKSTILVQHVCKSGNH